MIGVVILERRVLHVVFRPSHLAVSRAIADTISGKHLLVASTEFDFDCYSSHELDSKLFTKIIKIEKPDFRTRKLYDYGERMKIQKVKESIFLLNREVRTFNPEFVVIYSDEHILSRIVLADKNSKYILIEDGMVAYKKTSLMSRLRRKLRENTRDFFWKTATGFKISPWEGYGRTDFVDLFVKSFNSNLDNSKVRKVKVLGYPCFIASLGFRITDFQFRSKSERALFFIGQGLQGTNSYPDHEFYSLLAKLRDGLSGHFERFIYLPHPMEKGNSKRITDCGFSEVVTGRIAELTVLTSGYSSIQVCSLSSTALINLSFVGIPSFSLASMLGTDLSLLFGEEVLVNLKCPKSFTDIVEVAENSPPVSATAASGEARALAETFHSDLRTIFDS